MVDCICHTAIITYDIRCNMYVATYVTNETR